MPGQVYPADFADYVPSGASLLEVLHYVQQATPDCKHVVAGCKVVAGCLTK